LEFLNKSFFFKISVTLGLFFFSSQVSGEIQWFIALLLIGSVGLLHGANDLNLINALRILPESSRRKHLALYLSAVLLVLVVFSLNRPLALFFFIVISAFHFGQQHLSETLSGNVILRYLNYITYGSSIFGLLFYTHAIESSTAIAEISGIFFTVDDFLNFLLVSIATWIVAYIIVKPKGYVILGVELMILSLFYFLFTQVNLALAFAIYFALWHAIPSLNDQFRILYDEKVKRSWLVYLKQSALFWVLSIIGLAVVFSQVFLQNKTPLPLLVYFLAAITFPHVLVMSRVENALKS
jgi:Brp/Blh family beta-carotene 15,15'-monooxygenase